MDLLLPVSYNWEVVDEKEKKKRKQSIILYTIAELLPQQ